MKTITVSGLIFNLAGALFIAYAESFVPSIEEESKTSGSYNLKEAHHRLLETRVAQVGAILLAGFALRLADNILFDA